MSNLPTNLLRGANNQGGEAGAYTRQQLSAMRGTDRGEMLDKSLRTYIGRKGIVGPSNADPPQRTRIDLISPQAANFTSPVKVAVDLDVRPLPGVADPLSDHLVFLELTWGTGGGLQKARIDCRHGTQFSIAASSLEIAAVYDQGNLQLVGPSYEVSVAACYGEASPSDPGSVTRTFRQETLANLTELAADLLIPSHATHVAWYSRTDPAVLGATGGNIRQKDAGGGILVQSAVPSLTWVPLVNGADLANILSTSPGGSDLGLTFAIQL